MKEFLFSYGTLQNTDVQLKIFGRFLNCKKDILKGFKTSVIEITDKNFLSRGEDKYQQTLIPSQNDSDFIAGTVFEISEIELSLADSYEPNNYNRIKVKLESGREAWIFIAD